MYRQVRFKNIVVNYLPVLDGGGARFGQQYLKAVTDRIGVVEHAFEFCAGPGFIGFSLLAHGLCQRLTLADINPVAVRAAETTVRENGLGDRVRVYHSDCLDGIPASEKWDLIVSNPPHVPGDDAGYKKDIRLVDPGMNIHERFYRDVGKFMNPGAHILMQEHSYSAPASLFEPMLAANGFETIDVFRVPLSWMVGFYAGVPYDVLDSVLGPVESYLFGPADRGLAAFDWYRRLKGTRRMNPGTYFLWAKRAANK